MCVCVRACARACAFVRACDVEISCVGNLANDLQATHLEIGLLTILLCLRVAQ